MEKLNIINVEVKEKENQLRVIVETVYGVDNLGLSIKKKYLDSDTEKPKWLTGAKKLLEKKYNKEVDIDELETLADSSVSILTDINNN